MAKPYFLFKGTSGKNAPCGGAVLVGPLKPTHLPDVPGGGNVRLDRDTGRYFLLSTGLTPIDLVNPGGATSSGLASAPAGRIVNAYRYRSPIGE